MPSKIVDEVKRLEELFTVSAEKLKEITAHFVSELERGMSPSGAARPSLRMQNHKLISRYRS